MYSMYFEELSVKFENIVRNTIVKENFIVVYSFLDENEDGKIIWLRIGKHKSIEDSNFYIALKLLLIGNNYGIEILKEKSYQGNTFKRDIRHIYQGDYEEVIGSVSIIQRNIESVILEFLKT